MDDRLDSVFAALSDPTRRAILGMLLEDDMAVTDVAEPFGISLAAVSKHLGVLTRAGLISQERRGRVVWCKLEPDAMRPPSVWMRGFGQFDPVDLDALERFLEIELEERDGAAEAHGRAGWSAVMKASLGSEHECDDHQNDDDQPDDIDDVVHVRPSLFVF